MKKHCWVAHKYRKGWRLAFCHGEENLHWLPFWFKDKKDIDTALKSGVVFVFLKEDGLLSG